MHFIYVTARRVILLRQTGSRLTVTGSVTRSTEDNAAQEEFGKLIQRYRKDPFTILVDSVDEELQSEQIPPINGRDLKALMARRIEQRTRDRRLATWRAIGLAPGLARFRRRPAGVGVMTAALGPDSGLQPWLRIALDRGAQVKDILSPALLAAGVARKLRHDANSGLLVTIQPAGIRQTLIVDGMVKFSRLAQLPDAGADSASVVAECTRTIQYLLMNQLVSRDLLSTGATRVWVVTDGMADPDRLPARLMADSASAIEIRSVRATELGALRIAGLAPSGLGSAHLWANRRLADESGRGYATPEIRNNHFFGWLGQLIRGGAVALTVLSVAAWLTIELMILAAAQHDADPIAQRRMQEHRELSEILARYPVPGTEMRQVVELDRRLRARALDPIEPLQRIALATADVPEVRLQKLSWQREGSAGVSADGRPAEAPAAPAPVPGNALPGASALPSSPAPAAVAAVEPAPKGREEITFRLLADIAPLGTKIGANRSAARFVERLKVHCGCEATLVTAPYDATPAVGFTGSLKTDKALSQAGFVVELTLRERPPAAATGGRHGQAG